MEQMCSSYVPVFGWAYTEACRKAGGYLISFLSINKKLNPIICYFCILVMSQNEVLIALEEK